MWKADCGLRNEPTAGRGNARNAQRQNAEGVRGTAEFGLPDAERRTPEVEDPAVPAYCSIERLPARWVASQ